MLHQPNSRPQGAARGCKPNTNSLCPGATLTPKATCTDGVMRLATAMDEIVPMKDRASRTNQAYLTVIFLTRVITRLGTLEVRKQPGNREAVFG